METYHKIQTLFKRDMDGSLTGKKGKMLEGEWTTPELAYLADKEWEFTEKVDGTNIRIGWNTSGVAPSFAGRTNNAVIPAPLAQYLDETFTHERFRQAFEQDSNGAEVILFGEGYGPKIQGGGKYRDDHSFVLFDVKIGDFWLDRDNVNDIASKLGIESVPMLGHGTLYDGILIVRGHRHRVKEAHRDFIVQGRFQSQWGDFEAEGIVARPKVPLFNRKGERIITKIKAVDFK